MINKKRNFLCFVCVVCFFLITAAGMKCGAKPKQPDAHVAVKDDASLLMEEEADWLKNIAQGLSDKSGWNIIVATCADAEGKSAQTVCEEYFNTYTVGEDGISCLADVDHQEIYLAAAGDAARYFNDSRIDEILDEAYQASFEEDYAQCLYLMLLGADKAYETGAVESATLGSKLLLAVIAVIIAGVAFWLGRFLPHSDFYIKL